MLLFLSINRVLIRFILTEQYWTVFSNNVRYTHHIETIMRHYGAGFRSFKCIVEWCRVGDENSVLLGFATSNAVNTWFYGIFSFLQWIAEVHLSTFLHRYVTKYQSDTQQVHKLHNTELNL